MQHLGRLSIVVGMMTVIAGIMGCGPKEEPTPPASPGAATAPQQPGQLPPGGQDVINSSKK
jgi:hypothetical protein